MLGPTNYVLGSAPRKLRAGKPHTLPCYTNEETKASDRKHLSQGWRQAAGGLETFFTAPFLFPQLSSP